MNFVKLFTRKIFTMLLVAMALNALCPIAIFAVPVDDRYLVLDPVSGLNPSLKLYVNKKSMNLDLSKTQNIRVRLKIDDLYSTIDSASSFKLNLYELEVDGTKKFISTQNLTISKKHFGNRILSVSAGYFASATKEILFEVYDTAGNLINSYETELLATNLDSQVLGAEGVNTGTADCDEGDFSDCQLDYLFQRISFEAKPQKQISTRVVKGEDGLYKVTIPVPRNNFKPLKNGTRHRSGSNTGGNGSGGNGGSNGNGGNGGNGNGGNGGGNGHGNGGSDDGGTTGSFGETTQTTTIVIGDSTTESGTINYDPDKDQIVLNENTFFGKDGQVGIGVDDPKGWLDIKAGDANTPPVVLNPGVLTAPPVNGAIEYDGDNLYFTSGGVRIDISSPMTLTSPVSDSQLSENVVLTDKDQIISNKTMTDIMLVSPIRFMEGRAHGKVLVSDVNGFATWGAPQFLGDYTSRTGNGAITVGNNLTGNGDYSIVLGKGNSTNDRLSNTINGSLVVGFNSNAATLFVGPSAGTNTTGNVGIGTTNPQGKLDVNGTIFTDNIRLSSGGTINGATLINSNISKLVAPDGSPNPALSVDNNGNVGIGTISPASLLHIVGNETTAGQMVIKGTVSNDSVLALHANLGTNTGDRWNLAARSDEGYFTISSRSAGSWVDVLNVKSNNVGIGTITPNQLLTVNGAVSIKESSAPSSTATFGKLYANSTNSKLYFLDDAGVSYNLINGSVAGTSAASGSNTQFQFNDGGTIGGNGALTFTKASKTLAVPSDAVLDINSTSVSIADIDITLDGASTTFTQSTGAITLTPANGSNLNVNLRGLSDFAVDTDKFVVNNNGAVGIGTASPIGELDIRNTTNSGYVRFSASDGGIDMASGDDARSYLDFKGSNSLSKDFQGRILYDDSLGMNFYANGNSTTSRLLVAKNGNIGVGTVAPQGALDVNGTLYTDNIMVSPGGTINGATLLNSNISKLVAPDGSPNPALSVDNNGNIQVGSIPVAAGLHTFGVNGDIYANQHVTDITKVLYGGYLFGKYTNSATKYLYAHQVESRPTVASGITNSGNATGSFSGALRNYDSAAIDDDGTLSSLMGMRTHFGHNNTLLAESPITTDVVGFYGQPYVLSGSITNLYGLYLDSKLSNANGTVSNYYGVYQKDSTAKNYFAGNLGIGTTATNQLLTVNGAVSIKETSAPSSTATFGKLYANTANSKLYFLDDSGVSYNLLNGSSAGTSAASGSNTQFQFNDGGVIGGNGALTFTKASKTLAVPSDTPLDINSTTVSIADTDITLDGASTTFTQSSGAMTMYPANGSNMNVRLDGVSDFVVDTNKFIVDNNGNVGIGTTNPAASLQIESLAGSFTSYLPGDGLTIRNHITSGGWARGFTIEAENGSDYMTIGAYGSGQNAFAYSYLGNTYNDKALNWTKGNLVGIAMPTTVSPTLQLSIGDANTGLQQTAEDVLNIYTGGARRVTVDNNGNVGIAIIAPNQKFTVNGAVAIKESSAPSLTATFGKLYANSTNSKLYFLDDSGVSYNLLNGSTTALTDATTLDAIDSSSFLRSDTSDSFTSGTLTFDAATGLDINSTSVSIADTDITLDGASTTLTQSTGAITLTPANGSNLNVNLRGLSDFAVDTNKLFVDNNGNVGIATSTPNYKFDLAQSSSTAAHFGPAADNGGYLTSINASQAVMSAGASYNGSNWVAKATSASLVSADAGLLVFGTNAGLTKGNTFTPTERMRIDTTGNLAIGTSSANQLLTVNGVVSIKETAAPSSTATFGKLYANTANSKLYFLDDSGLSYNLLNGSTTALTDATTLDAIDSSSFLRSDTSDSFTSGTLTFDAATGLDINSTTVSIADTDITLDGASTTFTQSTGAITLTPANGSNLNVNLSGLSDFAVDTSKFVVDNNGHVGIGTASPTADLHIAGNHMFFSGPSSETIAYPTVGNLGLSFMNNLRGNNSGYGWNSSAIGTNLCWNGSTFTYNRCHTFGVGNSVQGIIFSSADWQDGVEHNRMAFLLGHETDTPSEVMTIDASGNVGIGVKRPTASLQIGTADTTAMSGTENVLKISGMSSGDEGGEIELEFSADHDTNGNAFIIDAYREDLRIYPSGGSAPNQNFIINSITGNVGIGNWGASEKLEVSGTVRADKLTVDTGYAQIIGTGGDVTSTANYGLTFMNNHRGNNSGYGWEHSAIGTNLCWDDTAKTYNRCATGGVGNSVQGIIFSAMDWQDGAERNRMSFILGHETATPAEVMSIGANGRVGIGTSNPSQTLEVVGDVRIGASATLGCLQRADGGVLTGSCSSDERLKKEINPLLGMLDRVSLLRPVTYRWRSEEFPERHYGTGLQVGLIAQEVAKVFPELVVTDDKGYLTVNYSDLSMYSLGGLVELSHEVKDLKNENTSLSQELTVLKEENTVLKQYLCGKDPSAPFCK